MRLRKLCLFALLLLTAISAGAQMMPPVPVDTAVTMGKLDNGLTYYIRYNNWPEKRADFYIAQRVGSIQENDDQRGLAHFLEHMCFNGTDNFKGNDLIRYCESIGVKFGTDLNAYTSIDQTVYNISNVPTQRQSALDSCLLILHDWADGLILDPVEIDKERGVIHEEWRLRTSPIMRMFERNLPKLYPGSKYGERMPIGKMEIIDNFKPQVLRDYYEKWYRPDNQAIIVVGDVDVKHIEAEIKRLFGGIKMPQNPAEVKAEPVPDNAEPIVIVDKDKEMRMNILEMMIKHEAFPDSMKTDAGYILTKYVVNTAMSMLNERLAEYAQNPESPFVNASVSDGTYLFSKTMDALDMSAVPKDGQTEAALAAVYREVKRAADFGFTPTEYARAKENTMSSLDKMYSNKDKRYSSQYCNEYKEHYLANEPIPSIDDYYSLMKQIVPMIPIEMVNGLMKQLVPANDSNIVIYNFNIEKEGAVYPTEASLMKVLRDVRAEKLEAYVDNVKNEPLITSLPKAGKIAKETEDKILGFKTLTLSNGAKVILKHTDYKKDQVILAGEGFGGSSLLGDKDFTNIKMFDDVVEASGLGNFSNTELQKALAGKIAGASLSMSNTRVGINGQSTPKDVETMLQLVYLYFTSINKDQKSFDNLMNAYELQLKNKAVSPDAAFSDSINVTRYCHNPRFASVTMDDLKKVSYDRILEIAKQMTSNAAAFTFTIVGNYDEAAIRPLIEQYIGSLPSQKKVVKGKNVFTYAKGNVVNSFKRKMETPKATSIMIWSSQKVKYSLENTIRADMAGEVLSMVYLKKIREEASAAYSCGAQAGMNKNDFITNAQIFAYCPMKPEKGDTALMIMRDEVKNLSVTCDKEMFAKVKEYMLKNYDDKIKTNGYWASVIGEYVNYGIDLHTDFKKTVEAQTPQTVSAFVGELLKAGDHIEVTMMPDTEK